MWLGNRKSIPCNSIDVGEEYHFLLAWLRLQCLTGGALPNCCVLHLGAYSIRFFIEFRCLFGLFVYWLTLELLELFLQENVFQRWNLAVYYIYKGFSIKHQHALWQYDHVCEMYRSWSIIQPIAKPFTFMWSWIISGLSHIHLWHVLFCLFKTRIH